MPRWIPAFPADGVRINPVSQDAKQSGAAPPEDGRMPNLTPKKTWLLCCGLLAVALVIRIGAAVWWQQRLGGEAAFAFGDSDSYWKLAASIFEGRPYQYGGPESKLMRMPGYPALLSLAYLFWGGEPPVVYGRAVGAIAGVFAVGGVYWIARRRFCELAAWPSGLLAAIYPGAVATSVFVLSEAAFCPLLVAQAGCWIEAISAASARGRFAWALAAGGGSAVAVYARPSWLLFPIFLTVFAAALDRTRIRHHVFIGVVAIVVMCLGVAPWWVRSYRYTGHFVLTTLEMGASLYDGLNPDADGGSNMDFKREFYRLQEAEDPEATPGQFAYRADRRMKQAALDWARSNPGRTIELAGIKLLRLWSPFPNAGQFRSTLMRLVVALGYLPLLALALWAVARFRSSHWSVIVVLIAPAFYISSLHLVFVSSIRYRQPAMLLACVLSGALLADLLSRNKSSSDSMVHDGAA